MGFRSGGPIAGIGGRSGERTEALDERRRTDDDQPLDPAPGDPARAGDRLLDHQPGLYPFRGAAGDPANLRANSPAHISFSRAESRGGGRAALAAELTGGHNVLLPLVQKMAPRS